ncbi:MAG: HYR domain-containing protein [Saprospirales bacterium]|nr:HYR domain-containing protein [Saprospirales bacterium]
MAIPSDAHYQAYDILGALSVVIAAANPDPVPANNWGSLSFDTQAQASLSIEKTLFTLGVSPGGTALYEVTICNTGPSDIAGIALVDVPGLNLVPGSLVISADADDLYIGAGRCVEVLVSARVALGAPVGGNFCNSAAVDDANALAGLGSTLPPVVNEPSTGNVCGNVVPSLPPADVQVLSLTHDTSPMIPGTTESFTFIVTNNGPSPAYGATILVDLADVNWVVDSYSFPSTWSYMGDGVFARLNPMPPGAVETFTLELGIPSDAIVNLAAFDELGPVVVSIASSSPDPNTANNTMLEILDSENHADLSITKDIVNTEVGPGETAIFNIVVNNAGPSDVDGVGFMDDLSPNASIFYFEPFNIDNFYVAAGQSKSFLVTAQVNEDGCGTVENCAWVSGPDYNIDGNPDNNGPSCASFDIYDDVDPVAAVCPPATIEVDNDPGICGAFIECYVEFTDNCDDFLDLELIKGLPCECEGGGEGEEEEEDVICGNIFPVGMTQVIWKATDDNGNMAFCEFMVMVSDTEQPTIECPDDIVVNLPSGDAVVVAGEATIFSQGPCGVTLTYPPPFGDDNCGDFLITNTSGLGATDNCTGADFEGCFAIGNWDISADGDGSVDTGNAPDDVTLNSADDGTNNPETRMCITIPSDGVLSFDWNYESDDDAPNFDPFGYEVNGVFFQLSDDLGANIQSGSVSIPVEAGDEFCFVQQSSDGCCGSAATVSSFFAFIDDSPPSPEYYEYGGTYTESFMITDASGNSEECSFTITVEDTNFPNIHCPNNFVVYTDDANCGAQVMYAYPLGLDNCPGWYVTTIYGPLPGQNFSLGNTVVEYIITDANGNSVTCDFKVRVVDGEAPTFFECAPDQEVETSNNGIDDCCAEVPRLKGDAVVGDNCQETGDLPLVALFYDEDYTDTQENCDGEAWNVRQHLENRGFDIVFIDRLEDYPTWSNALNQSSLLVIPALTGNGGFLTDIPNSVKSLLYSFVSTNGAKLLIMDGGAGPNNNAANILNEVYGYSLVDDCCYNGNLSYLNLENSLYTGFQHGPVAIEQYFQTKIISNLVWPAIPIYELALNGQVEDGWASVARLPKGDGDIIYFGWSFRNGGPLCGDADTEFTEVLDRALLHLAGQGSSSPSLRKLTARSAASTERSLK